jgi:Fe-S cluster biosynthesis and repair protein YggX
MNERIKELAEQAGFVFYDYHNYNGQDLGESIEAHNWGAAEKFAELIVRECLNIANKEHKMALEFNWDNDDTAQSIKDSIKKYFGSEE